MNDMQHIYIYMDDSGKISKFEDYAVFAGIVIKDGKQKSEFNNKYRAIVNSIKCKYCEKTNDNCKNECPEVKAVAISPTHRRRIINLSKSFTTFGVITYNKSLYSHIINDKGAKGRFNEYAQRRIIKNTVQHLINSGAINPNMPVYLHVNIDEMPTKSNGYYSLKDGLVEELRHGIINYNYSKQFKPIIHSDLEIQVIYKDSKKDLGIQMEDILANTIRHSFVINNNWFDTSEYLKRKCHIDVILRLP